MRIDKFLWCVRFYKTRSIAADEIKKNRVSLAGQTVKSSREVKPGDLIKIKKNQIDYQVEILQIPKSRVGPKLVPLHIVDRTEKEQYEILKLRKLSQEHYRNKGEGRPTKKDRRDFDDFVGADIDSDMADGDWDLFFSEVDDSKED
ncbi:MULTISPECIES: RNA-binding S4 domain-containing protein [unclassified Kaistella]|uniref:RNA-binding S4 domain-containing protein n=1 Tax=unclassified Kaistella TaxID=2762626 RepID=UPI002735D0E3|nr:MULTISPECIES: RNA-binding S4 domain-containing protein [unclassified Kaistella]MCZ2085223.1 RNA-binding S4 domain-containing protein [Flavobacteriales bacterium]MDP2453628.1 RNA-binding S4 domain-containing protein [Kaistella sp. SH11-4b]MDP2456685.1 RNA-binding S4 domain-containing protein [Kaistella sp. SH40-3]MDP2459441.1 RNA-binding S4 domain-containing protein [Kaistella sp. SH19-2b]